MYWSTLILIFLINKLGAADIDGPSIWRVTDSIGHTEEPHWDPRKNILYFVNIQEGQVYAYHFFSKILRKITLNGSASPVIPARHNPNLLLVGVNRSIVAVEWDGKNKLGATAVLTTVSNKYPESRFNDGKADKNGNLWWGTIGKELDLVVAPNQAYLYKVTKNNIKQPSVAIAPVTNSNGLAWNKANDKFYYIDTPTRKVVEYTYFNENSTISSTSRTAFDLNDYKTNITGLPDGMTIDDEDNLYVALYGGGSVIKVDPRTGKLLKIIPIPARDVTSVMFGGPELDILFVTTSKVSLTSLEKLQFPGAGSVFAVKNLNARGLPAFTADIINSVPTRNILENIFSQDLFPRESRNQNYVQAPGDSEPGLWESIINVFRGLF